MAELAVKRLTVLNPMGETRLAQERDLLSQRPTTLDGKVLGFLDEGSSPPYFERFEEMLRERFKPAQIHYWKKPLMSKPSPTPLIEEVAARCDIVVVGTAH